MGGCEGGKGHVKGARGSGGGFTVHLILNNALLCTIPFVLFPRFDGERTVCLFEKGFYYIALD